MLNHEPQLTREADKLLADVNQWIESIECLPHADRMALAAVRQRMQHDIRSAVMFATTPQQPAPKQPPGALARFLGMLGFKEVTP